MSRQVFREWRISDPRLSIGLCAAMAAVAAGLLLGGQSGLALAPVAALCVIAAWAFLSLRREGAGSGPDDRSSSQSPPDLAGEGGEDPRKALERVTADYSSRLRGITAERNRLETTLASIEEGVVAVDHLGTVIQMNGAAARFLRANVRYDLGLPFSEVCRNREISDLVRAAVTTQVFQKREAVDGGMVLDCYAGPLSEGAGTVLVLHDITEVRRLESVRRDFVANVSHELKTPLTAIKGYVETLLAGGLDDRENNLRFLRKVESHANRLTALITDLLSLSRIESGEAVAKRESVQVDEVLASSLARLAPSAERKGVRLGARLIEPRQRIMGDTEALNQIFDNLIDNAIKYTESGNRVEVSLLQKEGKVIFEVQDTGVGIPDEDLPRIFERFYRVDKARSRELGGTGLGLSIVRHLVNALEGEIRVRSKLGEGSTFTVLFPSHDGGESRGLAESGL